MEELTPQLKQIIENAQRVALARTEKDAMRREIEAYMRTHKKGGGMIPSPWATGRFLMVMHKPVALTLIVFMALGGGTAYASEGALPGDALYPIKVSIVEEARAVLALSNEGKIRWDAERAERRLEEAVALSAAGRLTDENEQMLEEHFEALSEQVAVRAQHVEDAGDERVAAAVLAEFEGALRGHAQVLATAQAIADAGDAVHMDAGTTLAAPAIKTSAHTEMALMALDTVETPIAARAAVVEHIDSAESRIVRKVAERLEKLERARANAEHKTVQRHDELKKTAKVRVEEAEQALERVEKDLKKRPERSDIQARIDDARARIQEARQSGDAGSSTESFIEAQAAMRTIEESHVLLKVNGEVIVDEHSDDDIEVHYESDSDDGKVKTNINIRAFNQNN